MPRPPDQGPMPSIISVETTDPALVAKFFRIGQDPIEWMDRRWNVGQIISTGNVSRLHRVELVEIVEDRR